MALKVAKHAEYVARKSIHRCILPFHHKDLSDQDMPPEPLLAFCTLLMKRKLRSTNPFPSPIYQVYAYQDYARLCPLVSLAGCGLFMPAHGSCLRTKSFHFWMYTCFLPNARGHILSRHTRLTAYTRVYCQSYDSAEAEISERIFPPESSSEEGPRCP
jgi:hypothetical protein